MVIGNSEAATAAAAANNSMSHPSGIPQEKIDNIMSGIANTGDVKMNNHRKKLRQRFDIIKKLGQGTYGKVQLGINKETGQEVAIKTIKKCKIEAEADLVRIRREVQIMSSVQHPNIIHIYEVFENREKMVLVMEFAAGGELYDYLSERKVLTEEEARRIFRQVSTAVYYCHKHKICHRDLKLENILLDEQGNAKIADFGLSNVFDDQRLLATFCGSPLYASPEIVEGTPYQGPEVDCWSLGVLLYTLVYGSMPFDGSNFKRLVKQISQGDYYEPKKPSRASTLIRDMLTVCPIKRATIEQICSHWWVNENDNVSCLDLAEDLANQTPVRLDVLLSLTPTAVTADQLVVPSADCGLAGKGSERVPRSHSVGSIRDISANTEAERRILDMVAAGGEAALMPSPTRTITPAQSPVQSKRKLQNTVSTENAAGAVKKKEKAGSSALFINENTSPLTEEETPMETEDTILEQHPPTPVVKQSPSAAFSKKDIEAVGDLCAQLMQQQNNATTTATTNVPQEAINIEQQLPPPTRQKTIGKLDSVVEAPEEKDATKVIKKFVNKHKTADLVNAINQSTPAATIDQNTTAVAATGTAPASTTAKTPTTSITPIPQFVRKCSLQDEVQLNKFNERRKSRILETAEKFQQMNAGANGAEKPKKFVLPGVSVGSFKKEFERKATEPPPQGPTAGERRALEQVAAAAAEEESAVSSQQATPLSQSNSIEGSDSKNSMTNFSLDEARRSMENSIALLRQAQNESTTKEVDQLCAKTQNIGVTDEDTELERERKLKNARAIIGNAIQPVIRRPVAPPTPFIGIGCGNFGGGDLTNMRAAGGGSFIGYGGSCGASGIVSPTLHLSSTFLSNTQASSLLPSNANAKSRQNTIERFGLGSSDVLNRNSFSSHSSSSPTQTPPLMQQQLQLLQQHKQHLTYHQNQHQSHYHNQNHMSMIPCLPPYAASASASAPSTPIATPTATAAINSSPKPFYNTPPVAYSSAKSLLKSSPGGDPNAGTVKTSSAQITLKSATLPRRKTAKTEIQLDIKPRIVEQSPMRFTTEMQHPITDLRSAPPRGGPLPYSPITTAINPRASSLEPKEHIIPIQRPQVVYTRTGSNTTNTTRSGSLSRQSTIESESDTTATNLSQSTITGSSQPIKKSPREFIIPIAVEGGGFITPREGSMEPSESSHTTSSRSTFSRLRPTRRIGSLLNETSVEEGLPFQKMKTASINRDIDDDSHFTFNRLRSSRPVKKISQETDSQSSGEEDDDDGFEILTAENLFSTLLQRVRALTNRLNVNNDITSGFPNSSRLLNNLRQGQSSFWNQEPFGSRLNNAGASNVGGAPWRHSMTRDLGSDMDSMFSRTGATLPRGNKSAKLYRKTMDDSSRSQPDDVTDATQNIRLEKEPTDEPLDLADLDLSRLRLSKKDLETLSNITPGLPKCFQEQLLAKLPPTQARKLSRTLSMQNNQQTTTVKIYKRSQSGGRGLSQEASHNDLKENVTAERKEENNTTDYKTTTQSTAAASNKTSDENSDRSSSIIYRRTLSRTHYDYDTAPSNTESSVKSRSNSVCRDDYGKSLCSSYSSDVSDKYKYYSPYLSKSNAPKDTPTESGSSISPLKRYGSVSPRESCLSPNNSSGNSSGAATLGRPPSGCLSPPPSISADGGSSSLRRRSSQRRISRFLRPDFFDEPAEESPFYREKKLRERETQSVLREIREKSRESSRDRLSQSSYSCEDSIYRRKHSMSSDESHITEKLDSPRHVRNKSMEMYSDRQDIGSSSQDPIKCQLRSLSRSREIYDQMDKNEIADKILTELQILSAVKSQQEKRLSVPREVSVERTVSNSSNVRTESSPRDDPLADDEEKEKTATIRRVKKLKPKEKSTEPADDPESRTSTTLVKKVKKIVKKTDATKIVARPTENIDVQEKCALTDIEKPKPESKLKRPKSYPTKDQTISIPKTEVSATVLSTKLPMKSTANVENNSEVINYNTTKPAVIPPSCIEHRENRLVRPKSYPASKLTPPKDLKKTTQSGVVIPITADACSITTSKSSNSRQSTSEEKSSSTTVTPTGKSSIDTSSSSESRPTAIKKIIKVTKKSKLIQPTVVTAPTNVENLSENLTTSLPQKEKSPEKKTSKGLLYAIGQKFEKLRDSAMSKDKKTLSTTSTSTATTTTKASSPDKASPEKTKEKSKLLKKKKSLDGTTTKTEKNITTPSEDTSKASKITVSSNEQQDKPTKSDKRSRIDSMIRSLRERSVPRTQPVTESNYIKRAVSVEDMPGTFNKNTVNKVLGLFKRFEKDGNDRKVRNTRSTSNIDRQSYESSDSPIYQNARDRPRSFGSTSTDPKSSKPNNQIFCQSETTDCKAACNCKTVPTHTSVAPLNKFPCPDCVQDNASNAMQKRNEESNPYDTMFQIQEQAQGNKDKRKALMLDLAKLEKLDNNSSVCSRTKAFPNGNGIYSNLPPYPGATSIQPILTNDNATNNNNTSITNNNNQISAMQTNYHPVSNYRTSSAHEINRNHMFSPSTENIGNYSSDSRSYQDDCASTSTFLSPTDEPELYFDNWSVCSEDNYMLATPSPTVSRLSRASQLSSPTRGGDGSDPNESIIDRIKRRSFYSRFNEKKPKRTSSIVGPTATRDYYREQQAAVKSRVSSNKPPTSTNERAPSPDITQQFFRPLKLSPVGNELKPPIYKSHLDYPSAAGKPRKSLNDIRPTTSPSFLSKRYGSSAANSNDNDYLSVKSNVPTRIKNTSGSSSYESNGGYYNTYNPKRRSSYNLNGMLPSGSNVSIDGYATVGRRPIRAYDQRTYSLLDAPSPSTTTSFRREVRTPIRDYSSSISRSNSNYRSPAPSRSPTNI